MTALRRHQHIAVLDMHSSLMTADVGGSNGRLARRHDSSSCTCHLLHASDHTYYQQNLWQKDLKGSLNAGGLEEKM